MGIPRATRLSLSCNLACAAALWTFENQLTEDAENKAGYEANIMDKELQRFREGLTSRGE